MSIEDDVKRVEEVTKALIGADDNPKILRKITLKLDEKQVRQAVANYASEQVRAKYWQCFTGFGTDKNGGTIAECDVYELDKPAPTASGFNAAKAYDKGQK